MSTSTIENNPNKHSNRILEIDLLRGIAVLFMILDHIMYDLWGLLPDMFLDYPIKLYNFASSYWVWDFRIYFRYFIVFIFMGLVGVCGSFSKSNINRGLKLLGIAMLLTIGTLILSIYTGSYFNLITFGTLHCIALSLIMIGIMQKFINNKWIYLIIGLIMVGFGAYNEYICEFAFIDESTKLKEMIEIIFGQILGSIEFGGDTMGFLLNGGQVLIGVFIGKLLYQKRESVFNFKYSNNVVTYVGRNSLLVYFLHQVIIPIVIGLILIMLGYHFVF